MRAKPDQEPRQPHQARWQRIGTAIGDLIQRDVLFAEKHFEKMTGKIPPFIFEKTATGQPMFEDFAKTNKEITHNGRTFYLYGTCDGIMQYRDAETGEILRVGLEVKSKQTTAAKTSARSMQKADPKHVAQCALYADMYDVDYYVILYVNASKKSWQYDADEYAKSPDIRAFGVEFDGTDQAEIYDNFVRILDAVDEGEPPALDLEHWTFNNFKTECAKSLMPVELDELEQQVAKVRQSNLPAFIKQNYRDALDEVYAIREKELSE